MATRTVLSVRIVKASQASGYGHSHYNAGNTGSNQPLPVRTSHVVSPTKTERHLRGNPYNRLNEPHGPAGAEMGVDRQTSQADGSSLLRPELRQMPDRNAVSKAAQVLESGGGSGLGARPEGTLGRG